MKKKKNWRKWFALAASVLLLADKSIPAFAESTADAGVLQGGGAAVTGQLDVGGYAAKLYDSSNGLPTSEANTILCTKDGFIWIGSYSGLIRYDGTSFLRYDSSTGITSGNTLYEDGQGRLWVGTNDNGVVMIHKGEIVRYNRKEGLLSSSVKAVTEGKDGIIYIGTTHGMAYIDTDMKLNVLNDPQINDAYIIRLVSDAEGIVYGVAKNGTCFSIKDKRITAYYNGQDIGMGELSTIFPDPDNPGYVYLGTDVDKIYYADFEGGMENAVKISVDPASGINWITYASGHIWVCSDNTIGYLDEGNQFVFLQNLPMNNSIGSMIEDYEGNLWFTSTRQGVMKIVSNRFTDLNEMTGMENRVVNSTCLQDGKLYVGTDTGLDIVDLDYRMYENELTEYLDGVRIRCITADLQGNLWFSTYNGGKGLVCYTPEEEIISFTEEDGLLDDKIRCTLTASDGSVLVASNGGMNILKDKKVTAGYGSESGINNTTILTVEEGADGKYYLGSDGDGIYVADGKKITRLGLDDGLTSEVILRIKKDEERGVYWIITSNSIAYMKDGTITTVQEFPYSNNFDLYFDDGGNAWILASNGIYVAKAEEMLKNGKFEYLFYDTSSGLPSVATVNSFSALDEAGNLYISGRNGVSSVNINNYFSNEGSLKIMVPYVEADDQRYYIEGDTVTIPSTAKVVTIYGFVLTYSMQNPQVQYFLEGFDDEVSQVGKKDMEPVRYTNLDGGKYVFDLSVVNSSTNEAQESYSLTIIKKLAFYEQPWFWIAAVGVLVVLSILLVRLYIKKKTQEIEKKANERREFVNEIIKAFAKCVDSKDEYTNGHSFRVAKYTRMLAEKLGESEENIEKYYNIALMHDIGKISIPDNILNKNSALDDKEYEIMKTHAENGFEILKDVKIQEDLAEGAHHHHERYDGKGYPDGLKGEEIPWVARIIAVADTFDAMYSTRPYRKKLPLEYVASEIEKGAGTQHDPVVVEKFMELVKEGAFDDE